MRSDQSCIQLVCTRVRTSARTPNILKQEDGEISSEEMTVGPVPQGHTVPAKRTGAGEIMDYKTVQDIKPNITFNKST